MVGKEQAVCHVWFEVELYGIDWVFVSIRVGCVYVKVICVVEGFAISCWRLSVRRRICILACMEGQCECG